MGVRREKAREREMCQTDQNNIINSWNTSRNPFKH
jgi:hypothetical protein